VTFDLDFLHVLDHDNSFPGIEGQLISIRGKDELFSYDATLTAELGGKCRNLTDGSVANGN